MHLNEADTEVDLITLTWPGRPNLTREIRRRRHLRDVIERHLPDDDTHGYAVMPDLSLKPSDRRRTEVELTARPGRGAHLLALMRVALRDELLPAGALLVFSPAYMQGTVEVRLTPQLPN